jgi:hypothetical protein
MSKYGAVAIGAVKRFRTGSCPSICEGWNESVAEVYFDSESSQGKNCPRTAFLGLCEEGLICGVPAGSYIGRENSPNKSHALDAVRLLSEQPSLADSAPAALWDLVLDGRTKRHNQQMHVVLDLWNNGLIKR